MAFLKKSLFLVLFLGMVSLSICEEEKRENEDEEKQEDDEQSEMKRGLWSTIKNVAAAAGKAALGALGEQ
uniref:Dermaseptin-H3 n=1 Tax=Pithecopus azureus TaxID=2034991 RepID=DMS3_PITAZ|nr:RecName: Full=Dermaseptin-H3; AltName: Full=Dermaseptin-like peptide 3; Short=DMS3; Flags: Precursor [Pithecopus azureus]CAK51561.1 preprodermaseptin H3 [Pithecopus azureus]